MIIRALASRTFFYVILATLVVQAVWIALSADYPMAFDENFHLGIIKLYAEHPSPFWQEHPVGGDAFGAVARDPSYIFHYLMSFPYRAIAAITHSLMAQVLFLRALNIAMFAACLPLFYRLLRRAGASAALTNSALAVFVLVPITPFLAAHINYDNLLMPVTAGLLLLVLRFTDNIRAKKVDARLVLSILVLAMFAALIKYAALPIVVPAVGYALFFAWRSLGIRVFARLLYRDVRASIRRPAVLALVALLTVLGVLAFERYGVNVVRYGTPVPDCGQVLTYNECKSYGPWIRDYNFAATNTKTPNPAFFTWEWLYGMWHRCFFAVDGPNNSYQTRGPLALPGMVAIVLALISLYALIRRGRAMFRHNNRIALQLFSAIIVFYIAVLFAQQFQMYAETGVPVAINGRYLWPIMPLIIVTGGLAVREIIRRPGYKAVLVSVALAGMLWGGGASTYILRSNNGWYWQNSPLKSVNELYRDITGPLTPGYRNSHLYLR